MKKVYTFASLLLGSLVLALTLTHLSASELSSTEIWKEYSSNPNAHPNIPNCSFAGYRSGEVALPDTKIVANVKECGAVGDGLTDDYGAFTKALKKAKDAGGGAIFVPAGTYKISGILRIDSSNLVVRGDGVGKTTLFFDKPLQDILGPSKSGTSSRYGWSCGLVWMGPANTFQPDGKINWGTGAQNWEEWQFRSRICDVTAPAKRGDFSLQVTDTTKIKPGQYVFLTYGNPQDLTLLKLIAGHVRMSEYDWAKNASALTGMDRWRWPVQVASVEKNKITLKQPLRVDIRPEFKVGIEELGEFIEECGLEKLTIKLKPHGKDLIQNANHLKDVGFNGIYINRAINCWVKDVAILDPENGVIKAACKNITVTGLTIGGSSTNHHATALRANSHDNLIEDFKIESRPKHGINTEALSAGNVWRNGTMKHGTFDSHRAMSFDLIRTNITINNDGKPGGGSLAGPFLGARCVHWNIRATGSAEFVNQPDCISMGALVGIQGIAITEQDAWAMVKGEKGCLIADQGKAPIISDLYQSQLELRLGKNTK